MKIITNLNWFLGDSPTIYPRYYNKIPPYCSPEFAAQAILSITGLLLKDIVKLTKHLGMCRKLAKSQEEKEFIQWIMEIMENFQPALILVN